MLIDFDKIYFVVGFGCFCHHWPAVMRMSHISVALSTARLGSRIAPSRGFLRSPFGVEVCGALHVHAMGKSFLCVYCMYGSLAWVWQRGNYFVPHTMFPHRAAAGIKGMWQRQKRKGCNTMLSSTSAVCIACRCPKPCFVAKCKKLEHGLKQKEGQG